MVENEARDVPGGFDADAPGLLPPDGRDVASQDRQSLSPAEMRDLDELGEHAAAVKHTGPFDAMNHAAALDAAPSLDLSSAEIEQLVRSAGSVSNEDLKDAASAVDEAAANEERFKYQDDRLHNLSVALTELLAAQSTSEGDQSLIARLRDGAQVAGSRINSEEQIALQQSAPSRWHRSGSRVLWRR